MQPLEPQPLTSRLWALGLALPLVVLLLIGAAFFFGGSSSGSLGGGKPFDVSFTVAGERSPRSLSQFRGRVIVVALWSESCTPCNAQIMALQQLADRYGRQGLLSLVLTTEPQGPGSSLLEAHIYPNEAASLPTARPATLILDREGRIQAQFDTLQTFDELETKLRTLLGS